MDLIYILANIEESVAFTKKWKKGWVVDALHLTHAPGRPKYDFLEDLSEY
jgi:hypothetical protein